DKLNDDEVAEFSSFAWSSHEPQIATANGTGVHGWDLRTSSEAFYIDSAHHIGVRSVDYNAHKAFALSSVRSPVNRRRNVGIGKPTDGLVRDYVDHHESVYSARWSAADPWMFASVSYDGLVAINVVPEDERLRIM
ncbi:hypothetical protein GQ42DRAFT_107614, partial [Ramicandelaber brevisporus]